MVESLDSTENSFTVFVPTDEAFGKLPSSQFDAIFADKDIVRKVRLKNFAVMDKN